MSPRNDRHRLGGVVGIENDPQPLVGVRRITRSFGCDDRFDIGRLENPLEAEGHTRGDRPDGRTSSPAIEPLQGCGLLGVFFKFLWRVIGSDAT